MSGFNCSVDSSDMSAGQWALQRDRKSLLITLSPEESNLGADELVLAIQAKLAPVLAENAARARRNQAKYERHSVALDRYNSRQSSQKPTAEVHESEVSFGKILVSGLASLSAELQVGALKAIAEILLLDKDRAALFKYSELQFQDHGANFQSRQEAARKSWLDAHPTPAELKDQQPFRSIMSQWLKSGNKDLQWFPAYLENPDNFYQATMSSSFLRELVEYFNDPSVQDAQAKTGLPSRVFVYDCSKSIDFIGDLTILAHAPRFPLNLKFQDKKEWSDEEFRLLLGLLRASQSNGMNEVDFDYSSFTHPQLKALLELVEAHNVKEAKFCSLKSLHFRSSHSFYSSFSAAAEIPSGEQLLASIKSACEKNFRVVNCAWALSLLDSGASSVQVPSRSGQQDEKEQLAVDREVSQLQPMLPAIAPSRRPLGALLAQIAGTKAQVHLQLQQQQQEQQEQQQEEGWSQEQHQNANKGLQAIDAKEVIHYAAWMKKAEGYSSEYLSRLTALQKKQLNIDPNDYSRDRYKEAWFEWTLSGLKLEHNLDGFSDPALKKICEHITLFRDGFDMDRLPGFAVRHAQVGKEQQRVLVYYPDLPASTDPLAVILTQPAATSAFTIDPKMPELLKQLAEAKYCSASRYNSEGERKNGLCLCIGCTDNPAHKNKDSDAKVTEAIFSNKQTQQESLSGFDLEERLRDVDKNDETPLKTVFDRLVSDLTFRWSAFGGSDKLVHKAARDAAKRCVHAFVKNKIGLDLPIDSSRDRLSNKRDPWLQFGARAVAEALKKLSGEKGDAKEDEQLLDTYWGDLVKATHDHRENLADQRAAFYALFWKGRPAADVDRDFPILKRFSLRHLRLLLEIAAKFDLRSDEKSEDSARVMEALLRNFQQINTLDGSTTTFDTLFQHALNPSDSWMASLFTEDGNSLRALSGLCALSPTERANWNWLLKRHGESCGYADLGHLWSAFQFFNSEYRRLTGGLDPLDLTKFPEDSVKDTRLFLGFLLTIITNARSKAEQVEILRTGTIGVKQTGAYYTSRYQGYFLVDETTMAFGVTKRQIKAAKKSIESTYQTARQSWDSDEEEVEEKGAEEKAQVIDYRVDRAALFEHPDSVHFYRYIGQQPRVALTLLDYQSLIKESDFGRNKRLLLLLAITSANERAAGFKERAATKLLWGQLAEQEGGGSLGSIQKTFGRLLEKDGGNRADAPLIDALLDWHRDERFSPLTFVEAATLLRLWQTQAKEQKDLPLIQQTKAFIDNALYRDAFLRVLREVYAQSGLSLLPLADYIHYTRQLMDVLTEEKEAKTAKELCWFVSRIAPLKPQAEQKEGAQSWLGFTEKLGVLQQKRSAEGHSVAKRLIVMLQGLPPGSVTLAQLNQLLEAALLFTADSSPTDQALFGWLQQQGEQYRKLTYSPLRSNLAHPASVQASIGTLVAEFRVKGQQQEQLRQILERLWDPEEALSNFDETEPEQKQVLIEKNEQIKTQARSCLRVLFAKDAVWRQCSDTLLSLLAEHPQLNHYSFAFLERLLGAVKALPFIDSELTLLKDLLGTEDIGQIKILLGAQEPFCEAVRRICALETLNQGQRRESLLLLRRYISQYYSDDLKIAEVVDFIEEFTRSYPNATEDMLTLANHAMQQGCLVEILKSCSVLRRAQNSKAQQLPALLHGLAAGADAKSSSAILEKCADPSTDPQIVEILAKSLGRKDSAVEVVDFLELLHALHQYNKPAFKLLHTLCAHPPKLGIKKLYTSLTQDGEWLPQESLLGKLKELEIDPHGKRTQQEPLDTKRLAANLSLATDSSRHVDGKPKALFASQQQQLLDMVVAIRALGEEVAAFPNGEGQDLPASQLSHAQLAVLMKSYRALLSEENISETRKQKILLHAIPLMREAMYRGHHKKLFANDSQIAAVCNTMVRRTDDHCFTQIDTGQGKTLINAFNAACMWLLCGEVRVLTSDSGLAKRDLNELRPFFELLGIPLASTIITQDSSEADYCQEGISYTTSGGLNLSAQDVHLTGSAKALFPKRVGLVVDEVDDLFFDDHTDHRHTVAQTQSDSNGESPIAIYYQAMESHFLESKAYQELLADKDNASEGLAFEALQTFLLELPASSAQKEALLGLLRNRPDQLRTWFISIVRAKGMQEKNGFTWTESTEVIDGELRKVKKVCPYSTSGRSNPSVAFSDGLQQLLQARKRRETRDPSFLIQQESDVLLSSNNASIFNAGYLRIVGTTGTVGSAQEISRRLRRFPVRVNAMPPHQKRQRVDHEPEPYADAKAHEAAVKERLRERLRVSDEPILVITSTPQRLEARSAWFEEVIKEAEFANLGLTFQTLNGEEGHATEQDVIKQAGKTRTITLATSLAGRGFDVVLDAKQTSALLDSESDSDSTGDDKEQEAKKVTRLYETIIDPPANKRKEGQCQGRSGRQGQPGETCIIINQQDLITKDGQEAKDLEDFYAKNEAHDYREWQLKSYLGYVFNALSPRFLEIHEQARFSDEMRLFWESAQIALLKDLHQKWENLKEEARLEEASGSDYDQALKSCQEQLLEYSCRRWNDALTRLSAHLNSFDRQQRAHYEQAKAERRSAQVSNKEEKKEEKQAISGEFDKEWEETGLHRQVSAALDRLKDFNVATEVLAKEIPSEQLPYFDLPAPSDADPAHQNLAPAVDTAQKTPGLESKESIKEKILGRQGARKAIQDALQVLLKTKFLNEQTPADEIAGATEQYLRKHYESFQRLTVNSEEAREFKRTNDMLPQTGHSPDSCCLTPVLVLARVGEEEIRVSLRLDFVNAQVLMLPEPVPEPVPEPTPAPDTRSMLGAQSLPPFHQNASRPVPLAKQNRGFFGFRPTQTILKQPANTRGLPLSTRNGGVSRPDSTSESSIGLMVSGNDENFDASKPGKSHARYYWLALALLGLCLLAGAALAVSGLAASWGVPLMALAGWSLTTAFSTATFAVPGFWALAGIGATYGALAFLAVLAVAGIIQMARSTRKGKDSGGLPSSLILPTDSSGDSLQTDALVPETPAHERLSQSGAQAEGQPVQESSRQPNHNKGV